MVATVVVVAGAIAGSAWWLLAAADADPGRVNAVRGALTAEAAAGGGMGLLLAFRRQQYHETDATEQRITGRYTAAIDQLGSDKLDVRIGGIYALERLAHDSPGDHATIIDVLAAFVREHTRHNRTEPPDRGGGSPNEPDSAQPKGPPEPAADVQAALTVLGRRTADQDIRPINLAGADLVGADLVGANLASARLADVFLLYAEMADANLSGAYLADADLSYVFLVDADLTDADLTKAHLFDSYLSRTDFRRAVLIGAELGGAHLEGACLTDADLAHADLMHADLFGADLIGANLTGANLDSARLTGVVYDASTRWPKDFTPPPDASNAELPDMAP